MSPQARGVSNLRSNCPNRPTKIREHLLAVACRRETFGQFLAWFKRGCKGANLLDLALQGGPKNAGKKPSSRKRSNVKRPIANIYVDMLDKETEPKRWGEVSPEMQQGQSGPENNITAGVQPCDIQNNGHFQSSQRRVSIPARPTNVNSLQGLHHNQQLQQQ